MSRSSSVKTWRKNTKQRLVDAFGSKCCICGYNKCNEALEFHHLNPEEKEFRLGAARGSIISWDRLVIEVRKCILLCANCHREIHAGSIELPSVLIRFNEEYSTYRPIPKKHILDKCYNTKCNNTKPSNQKYCSKSCSGTQTKLVDWNLYDKELPELYKHKKVYEIAEQLNVSWSVVSRRLKKLGLK